MDRLYVPIATMLLSLGVTAPCRSADPGTHSPGGEADPAQAPGSAERAGSAGSLEILANRGFDLPLDKKGRIPLWQEEKDDKLLPGRRGGSQRLEASLTTLPADQADKPRGSPDSQLVVTTTADWYGVAGIDYPVPSWSDRFELTARARCESGVQAQLLVVWSDESAQHVIRVQMGTPEMAKDWKRISTGVLDLPAGASSLRPVLVARRVSRGGDDVIRTASNVWFDDVELRTLPPLKRRVRVVVNQVGYGVDGPKKATVLTNFMPEGGMPPPFQVLTTDERTALQSNLRYGGRMLGADQADWGWKFWTADFSDLKVDGRYRIRATVGDTEDTSFAFTVESDVLFRQTAPAVVDFFFVQRCGFAVPGWHAACHMDDAKLPEGKHRDLTGGWHSAGDYNKLAWEYGDGGVLYALAHAADSAPELFSKIHRDRDGLPDILDEARWGAAYLAKIQIPETGGFLYHIQQGPDRSTWMRWVPPEQQTDNIPGTADDPIVQSGGEGHSPLAFGGWARLGRVLTKLSISNDYIERAVKGWAYATRDASSESDPLLLLSSIDLFAVTGEDRFKAFGRRSAERLLAASPPQGHLKGGYSDMGDIPAAALGLFALSFPEEPVSARIKNRLREHLTAYVREPANPLGLTHQKPGDGGYFFEPTSTLGQNYLILCRAWSALVLYRLLGERAAWEYALDQLDFVLGRNTVNLCMLEGKGSFNPPRYHHRYDSIPGHERGAVPGAIPNGFVRDIAGYDRPGFDLSKTGRPHPSYRTSEPWLVHNVFYMLAVTALHEIER